MRRNTGSLLGLAAAAALAVGCGGSPPVEVNPYESANVAQRWNAVLTSPSRLAGVVQIRGTAWMGPGDGEGRTRVAVRIENATPGGEHPWAVHRGRCGQDMGVVGAPDAYEALKVGGDGTASRETTLEMPLPGSGDYMVEVVASPDNRGTVVACGNLAPPNR